MLRGEVSIPVLGLGVYMLPSGEATQKVVRHALATGWRHVDTARIYGNEEDVGKAIRESGVPRDEVFVTTKLWNSDHGYDRALRACDTSLRALGFDRIDLYLVHWPEKRRKDTWRAMKKLHDDGKCRAIGVSNFTVRHLEELLDAGGPVPAVNQIEIHPFCFSRDIVAFCEKHGIVIEAYSPLTRGERIGDPRLVAIAKAANKTPAQVLIRWGIQRGFVSLPKSARPTRLDENAAVFDFELDAEAMKKLDALDEKLHTCWDPTNVP
jgi:methylglyoxal/glyoxal reductase